MLFCLAYQSVLCIGTFSFFFFCPFSVPNRMKKCPCCSTHNKLNKKLLLQLFGSFCMTLNLWMTLIVYSKKCSKILKYLGINFKTYWLFLQTVRLMCNFTIFVTQKSKPSQMSPCYPSKNILWLFILSQIPHEVIQLRQYWILKLKVKSTFTSSISQTLPVLDYFKWENAVWLNTSLHVLHIINRIRSIPNLAMIFFFFKQRFSSSDFMLWSQ